MLEKPIGDFFLENNIAQFQQTANTEIIVCIYFGTLDFRKNVIYTIC